MQYYIERDRDYFRERKRVIVLYRKKARKGEHSREERWMQYYIERKRERCILLQRKKERQYYRERERDGIKEKERKIV